MAGSIKSVTNAEPQSLFEKIWSSHTIEVDESGLTLLYVDRQLVHEVSSAQAFEGLRVAGRTIWRSNATLATPDHQVPTTDREKGLAGFSDEIARLQVATLADNCKQFDILEFGIKDKRQGIVHVIGPEQGLTLPGMTLVCGDSHTSTHGAFAALAQGVGTSEVEHVLATQCLTQKKPKSMLVKIDGELPFGSTAKDLILYVVGQVGCAGANGYVIEFAGSTIQQLSMEARMTVCNMSIEMGATAGMVGFDIITEDYLRGRPYAPDGDMFEKALVQWRDACSDEGAYFDKHYQFDAGDIAPHVTWGTKPDQVIPITGKTPSPDSIGNEMMRNNYQQALDYMDLKPNVFIAGTPIDRVFIGSCTNGRIEDIRNVAQIVKGSKVAKNIKQAIVVPGSGLVKLQAEEEGLHEIIMTAGFEWRDPGCSMCNAMNPDQLEPGERCASTSNRNFEGRQGRQGRTHLLSPALASAAALAGRLVDVREVGQ